MSILLDCLTGVGRAHASRWLDSFDAGPDRDRILGDNWAKEENFCLRIGGALGSELQNVWHDGDPPVLAIAAITSDNDFCATETVVADPGGSLSRVMTVHTLAKFHLDTSMPLTRDLTDAALLALLKDLDAADLVGSLRGAHLFCWATHTDDIAVIATADELRDLLGLAFRLETALTDVRRDMEWLVEVSYFSATPNSLHRPTVLEAQGSVEFKPSQEGSNHGWTMNLSSGDPGVREYVHPSFPASLMTGPITSRGRITSDPPIEWIAIRLSAI